MSAYVSAYNAHACYYLSLNGVCKKDGRVCPNWKTGGECGLYINHNESVKVSTIEPHLRSLVLEAAKEHKMIYVETDDFRFTDVDLNNMMNDIVLKHPQLSSYVKIDATRNGDYLVMVYEGVGKVLVN